MASTRVVTAGGGDHGGVDAEPPGHQRHRRPDGRGPGADRDQRESDDERDPRADQRGPDHQPGDRRRRALDGTHPGLAHAVEYPPGADRVDLLEHRCRGVLVQQPEQHPGIGGVAAGEQLGQIVGAQLPLPVGDGGEVAVGQRPAQQAGDPVGPVRVGLAGAAFNSAQRRTPTGTGVVACAVVGGGAPHARPRGGDGSLPCRRADGVGRLDGPARTADRRRPPRGVYVRVSPWPRRSGAAGC